ncbi:MAG: histidinol-phosphate transaminase [Burkholderiales bacterium]
MNTHASAVARDLCDRAPDYVRSIAPYQPGKPVSELAREMGRDESRIIKLASNENPMGASPRALLAMRSALDEVARYPDGNSFELKAALAEKFGVAQNQLILGNGSNDVLELAARAFLGPGSSAVYSRHAFAVYPLAVQATGAAGIEVPAREFGHDLPAMASAVRKDTRVIFVANPNNPTGTWNPPDSILTFLRTVPRQVLVVLDEAYFEYLDPAQRGAAVAWIREYPNLVVTRTFSKAYGLAGMRVGYAVASVEVADLLNRVRQPFNVSNVAQVGAIAALADEAFVEASRALNRRGMQQVVSGFERLGLSWIASQGNFVSVRVGKGMEVFQGLLKLGVIVRPTTGYGMPEHLRITIGTAPENSRFLDALEAVLK